MGDIRIADRRPDYCSSCYSVSAERYVDMDAAYEGPVVVNEKGEPVVTGLNGQPSAADQIYHCDRCIQRAAEVLEFRPSLHRTHLAEIRRLRAENTGLHAENEQLRARIGVERFAGVA